LFLQRENHNLFRVILFKFKLQSYEHEASLNIDFKVWTRIIKCKWLNVSSRCKVWWNSFYHWGACYLQVLILKIIPKSSARENKFHFIHYISNSKFLRIKWVCMYFAHKFRFKLEIKYMQEFINW
jgi:hypothetical protein